MSAIELTDVRKAFTTRRRAAGALRRRVVVNAVDGVSFAVAPGEVVGYVGPNGAGKSTTVKMLTGILVPTSGRVRVAGLEPSRQRVALARRIGVVFGQRTQLWWDLPLRDSFDLLRHVYRVDRDRHRRNVADFVELLDLDGFLETPVRQLSLGQRMRGDLVAALLHEPDVVFLDEPTIGLDVVAKERIRAFLATLNRDRRTTVLLTTHDMDDIERLCGRLLVVDHGRVIYDGDLPSLKGRFGRETVLVVDTVEPVPPLVVPGTEVLEVDGLRQRLRFRRAERSAADVVADVTARVRIRDLALEEPAIEDVVRRIYEQRHAAAGGGGEGPAVV